MNFQVLCAVCAAALFALAGCSQMRDDTSRGSSSAGSSSSYPSGSTATPSGRSPGQGAGTSGSATNDASIGTTQDERTRRSAPAR